MSGPTRGKPRDLSGELDREITPIIAADIDKIRSCLESATAAVEFSENSKHPEIRGQ